SEQPCVTCAVSKRSLSYAQVREASRRWALALASQLRLRPGHVVALLLPNMPEYLPAIQGALLAGLSVTMANPLYTAEELRRQFGDAGARVVATVPALAATARAAVGPATPIALLEAAGAEAAAALPEGDPDAVAALPYSSGTTGLPKGVMLTHRNLVANIECMSVPQLRHPTLLAVVPSLLQFLAVHPAVTREMLQSVRVVVSGAAPATEALLNKFRLKSGRDDLVVSQGYGMTETAPVTLLVPLAVRREKETSIGRVIPNTRARVLRADGADAAPREHGELLVTGPQLMKGYLNNEKATQETIDEEGWLHTGDVVYYDEENYFYIVDRTKELIKVKGNQVSPTELENLVMELPEVADCAVVGIPDDRHDELPRAFVVLHPNKKLSQEQIKKHIEPRVVKYKRLEGGVIFLDKIPRNPSGKILRQVLKAWKPEQ
ncbi:Luciferin 4-monooxygenase, partial [Gryllus bimaculatus]